MKLREALRRLAEGGPERQAVEAGEIDAVIDYASSNVILLPAARRALRELAGRSAAANVDAANERSTANRLLAALPPAEYEYLIAGLEPVTLKQGEVLHEPGAPIEHVYFPIGSVICLMATVETHQLLEVGLVGHEGMVGMSLVLGGGVSAVRAMVQGAGAAFRMKAARFRQALRQCLSLQRELHRFADEMLAQARQTAACNHFHAVEARVARYMLMTGDRVQSAQFLFTQEFLASALGLRRGTVNAAAGALQQRKLIRYSRGRITILDRTGLEAASCRCYKKIEGLHLAA